MPTVEEAREAKAAKADLASTTGPEIPLSESEQAGLAKTKVQQVAYKRQIEAKLKAEPKVRIRTNVSKGDALRFEKGSIPATIGGFTTWVPMNATTSVPRSVAALLKTARLCEVLDDA